MSLRWIPATAKVPPRSSASSAGSTRSPTGANRIAASSGTGGGSAAPCADAAPSSSASSRASAPRVITCTSAPWRQRDLRGDVGAAAEPVEAEPTARRQRGAQQRAVADDAGAQQRRKLAVAVAARQMVGESRGDRGEFGVAAVGVPTGVARSGHRFSSPADSTCRRRRCAVARRSRPGHRPRTRRRPRRRPPRLRRPLRVRASRSRRCTGRSPSVTCRSVRHTPHARTATSSSDGSGRGTWVLTRSSGSVFIGPGRRTRHAFMVMGTACRSTARLQWISPT